MIPSIKPSEFEIEQKRKELQVYRDYFAARLHYIFSFMPAPARILNLETGEWTIKNDEKWQALIDKELKEQENFLKDKFPNNQ